MNRTIVTFFILTVCSASSVEIDNPDITKFKFDQTGQTPEEIMLEKEKGDRYESYSILLKTGNYSEGTVHWYDGRFHSGYAVLEKLSGQFRTKKSANEKDPTIAALNFTRARNFYNKQQQQLEATTKRVSFCNQIANIFCNKKAKGE